ncbi:MFS transporter [Microtetraspora fusca]|uniref:MFS transporter n=1 Tax=Microtetraspora fusca TaxID=1997 RepID=UPI0008359192|nr:MFS transporter [Microtetraspora fusca]
MPTTVARPASLKRVAAASFTGTALEWYDYYLFGTAAALVFNTAFFTDLDPLAGTLASFATFAIGFVARPLGAAVFGHVGDRYGRKRSLLITIVMMGAVTGAMGILPTYETIGLAAPALLIVLRFLQGIAMGGEWSGASALITEHSEQRNRGFYAMLPQLGNPVGILVGVGVFTLLTNIQSPESFQAWGWRVPFLLAVPFTIVALWIRTAIDESRHFAAEAGGAEAEVAERRIPLVQVFRAEKTRLLAGIGVAFLGIAGYYFSDTFLLNYGTRQLGIDISFLLNAGLVASVLNIPLFVLWGLYANRVGGTTIAVIGGIATVLFAYPMFVLVGQGSALAVAVAMVTGSTLVSISFAASGQILNELFPTATRQSGIGLAYNLAGAVSGFVPFIATVIIDAAGDARLWATAGLLVVIALITLGSTVAARRLRLPDLDTTVD